MRYLGTLIISALVLTLAVVGVAWSQECGPGCPACSGKSTGELLSSKVILGSWLYIPDGEEETSVLKISSGLFSWMDLGIGYAVDAEKTIWSLRVKPISQDQDGWRPAVILGIGSVQTGGSDQSGYVQIAKTLELVEGRLGLYLAGGYATDLPDTREDWGLGTISMTLYERVSPFYTYDGSNAHSGLSYVATEWLTLKGYLLEMEEPALGLSVQWGGAGAE